MAGVDQGAAQIQATFEGRLLDRMYLTGLGFEGGHGVPTPSPGQNGLFETVPLDFLGLAGPRTNTPRGAAPVVTHGSAGVATVVQSDKAAAMLDWFEQMHILPRTKIEFGNIITQKQETYEIYSAFRNSSVTLDTIVNNVLPGVSLPDESTPEVVPPQSSMLDAATTDNCGDAFVLGTIVPRDILALANGLPSFDASIDFTFDSGDTPQLLVSGSRIVLIPMEYEAPVKETLVFLTDIITGLSGAEQRIALRKNPRQLFEVIYKLDGNDRQRMQALLMDWTGNVFGFPLWHEKLTLTAATIVGATQYNVTGADDVDLRVGGQAVVFTDSNIFDVITIQAKTDTLITAEDVNLNAYPVGTTIMPVRTATVVGAVTGQLSQNNLEVFKIIFEVTDNDTGALTGSTAAYSTFNSKVLFDGCNVMANTMAEQYTRRIYRIDNKTGVVHRGTTWDRNKRSSQKGFVLHNRTEILNFRKLLIALQGRQKSFYIPTFIEDLEVVANLSVGVDTMDIERIEYERFIQSREPKITFKITFNDGTNLIREVQSAASVDTTTERLTLDTTWPANRTVAEIVRIEFYELVRFDADNIVIDYPRIGLANSRMPVKQVFDIN